MDCKSNEVLLLTFKKIGNRYYKNEQYKKAISFYSAGIVRFDKKLTNADSAKLQLGALFNNRAACYIKLYKYHKALRDLNWIIEAFKGEPVPNISPHSNIIPLVTTAGKYAGMHDSYCYPGAIKLCTKALHRRARIFWDLGNSGRAYGDCSALISKPFKQGELAYLMQLNLKNKMHPSPSTLAKCNERTIPLNIFPKIGWTQIKPAPNTNPLPLKSGHSMIRFGSEIYSVGG